MRQRRWLAPPDRPSAVYHCVSRIVDRRFLIDGAEKELFRSLLLEISEFCQVRVLTFCILSNHFHLLVEVPRPPIPLPTAEETLTALSRLSSHQDLSGLRLQLAAIRRSNDPSAEARWLENFHARRWNLSNFLKLLKQRFSTTYNRRTGRKGTLWEERFRSILVEGAGHALVTMAAYIDLNPIRAGLAEDPKDYRWSGYGEAVAGNAQARAGILRIAQALLGSHEVGESEALAVYRKHLFLQGCEVQEAIGQDGRLARGAISREAVLRVLAAKGSLAPAEYLRCRVRYFTDGAVFGSRAFVEGIFAACRDRFGPRRKSGARSVRGLGEISLYTVRALRMNVFG